MTVPDVDCVRAALIRYADGPPYDWQYVLWFNRRLVVDDYPDLRDVEWLRPDAG